MTFKKILNKLWLTIFLISIFIIPISVNAYTKKVILGGNNLGIEVHSNGVLVVGFYNINSKSPGQDAGLKIGDLITKINDTTISTINDLTDSVNTSTSNLNVTYKRNGKYYDTNLELILDEGIYKTGVYVKDEIIGIGTLTFIDPLTNMYGALGHEIDESTTGMKFEIKDGKIFETNVIDVKKSTRNDPGEKKATYNTDIVYGDVLKNTAVGIFGNFNSSYDSSRLIDVASDEEIALGDAYFYTVINADQIEKYKINILNINKDSDTKNILFEVVDQELLAKTNGIVQGMSGSPIVQNNKIIGAVTHVVVDNPIKGYGVFINNMLKEIE